MSTAKRAAIELPDTIGGQLPGKPCPKNPGLRRIKKGGPVPDGWVIARQNAFYYYIERPNELTGLMRGKKQMWLRQHCEEVLDYYEKYGPEATKNRFILSQRTLDALLEGRRQPFTAPFGPTDKLEIRVDILNEDVRCLRKELRDIKKAFALFQQGVAGQITKKFLIPLLEQGIEPNPELERLPCLNPLSLEGFPSPGGNGEKATARHWGGKGGREDAGIR